MLYLPREPHKKLNTEQHAAWKKMRSLLLDADEVDRRYNALSGADGGRMISTDLARFLDERYAREPKAGGLRDIDPGWDLAWRYAQDRLDREIRDRGKRKRFRMMAGGWAAGKTHAVQREPTNKPELTWDGTLGELKWAVSMIELAIAEGWQVEIAYIYRNLELALYGVIERKNQVGRSVPLKELPKNHRQVQQTILNLALLFGGDPKVSFLFLHNLGKKGALAKPLKINLQELEQNGALHYLEKHEQYYAEASKHLEE